MRTAVRALTFAGVIAALAGVGYASQQTSKAAKAPATTAVTKSASATGKIVGFDATTKTLTIATAKGEEKFVLGSTVRLHEGAKTIAATNLSSLTGRQAKVRYTGSGSEKTAESVMVSGGGRARSK